MTSWLDGDQAQAAAAGRFELSVCLSATSLIYLGLAIVLVLLVRTIGRTANLEGQTALVQMRKV